VKLRYLLLRKLLVSAGVFNIHTHSTLRFTDSMSLMCLVQYCVSLISLLTSACCNAETSPDEWPMCVTFTFRLARITVMVNEDLT
jgi:hypothetical protein